MAITNEAKIKETYEYIKEVNGTSVIYKNGRINPFGAIVQFCQETGYLKKMPPNNFTGITATKAWVNAGGKTTQSKTFEDDGTGKTFNTVRGFRVYDSIDHFLLDYSGIITRLYPIALQNWDCVFGYIHGLCSNIYGSQWATDTKYFFNLCNMSKILAPSLVGDKWKKTLVNSYEVYIKRGQSYKYNINVWKRNHIEKMLGLPLTK